MAYLNERDRDKNTKPLGELVEKLLKAYRLDDKMKELDVVDAWEEMMGKAVAARTQQIYIKNNILYLVLDSSVMREELLHGKSIIIQRVNEFAQKEIIRDIWFG